MSENQKKTKNSLQQNETVPTNQETEPNFDLSKIKSEISILKRKIKTERNSHFNEIKTLNEKLIQTNSSLKETCKNNQKLKDELENLNNKVNETMIKRLKKEETKKKKTVVEKLDFKTELKIKENQFKNENSLINSLNKENQLLKKILEKYSNEKKNYLNNILTQKNEENKKLNQELFELKSLEKNHNNCSKEIENFQKQIYSLKNDIKLSNQTNINEENKFNSIQVRMINSKFALKNLQEKIKNRKSQSIEKENKKKITKNEEIKKNFQDFSEKNFKKENESENLFTEKEIEKFSLLFKNDELEFENFLKKLTCLENYKFAQEKKTSK